MHTQPVKTEEVKKVNVNTIADKVEKEAAQEVDHAKDLVNSGREKASENPELANNEALQKQMEKGKSDYDPSKLIVRGGEYDHPNFESVMDHIVSHKRDGKWWYDKEDGINGTYYVSYQEMVNDIIDKKDVVVDTKILKSTVGGQCTNYVIIAACGMVGLSSTVYSGAGSKWLKNA